ncbi:hypothetical protein BFP97_15090 [Roseivirga sp. 4D4]|uniref:FecR domain-containing protein n=1 Tax=Roseivirga sp. 4D4 TaxID=1889784 RepID=UPI000852D7DA|nr:FecR domain-containing protein [Roseivirga sp. 4D4]OEK02770.1 hypothetical protein BFP97_15090 [Roseivirga sp. 4D4]
MKEKAIISDHLLIDYLKQETSAEENRQVEDWLNSDPANQLELDKIRLVWEKSESLKDFEAIDLDKNWRSIRGKIGQNEKGVGSKWQIWKYAAAVLLIAAISVFLLRPGEVIMRQAMASTDPLEVVLADGSTVWLNEGATLDYPEEFSTSTREVTLSGEAYFDIAHNPEKPFRVMADGTTTEVLGTTFTVSEGEGESLELVLATGKVRFTKGNQRVTLTPGQMVVVDAKGEVTKRDNDNPNFMSWKTRTLTFEDAPMKEVIGEISSLYNVVLEIEDKDFLDCPLTTTFENESLDGVLETIALLFNIEIKQNGQLYQLSGKGCEF